jgi:hypothetical protein
VDCREGQERLLVFGRCLTLWRAWSREQIDADSYWRWIRPPPAFCIEFTLDLHILVDRMLTFVLLIVGFALLIKGVDFLIEGAIYE